MNKEICDFTGFIKINIFQQIQHIYIINELKWQCVMEANYSKNGKGLMRRETGQFRSLQSHHHQTYLSLEEPEEHEDVEDLFPSSYYGVLPAIKSNNKFWVWIFIGITHWATSEL